MKKIYVHVYFELHFVDKETYEYGLHNRVAYMSYCAVLTTRPNISYFNFFNQIIGKRCGVSQDDLSQRRNILTTN